MGQDAPESNTTKEDPKEEFHDTNEDAPADDEDVEPNPPALDPPEAPSDVPPPPEALPPPPPAAPTDVSESETTMESTSETTGENAAVVDTDTDTDTAKEAETTQSEETTKEEEGFTTPTRAKKEVKDSTDETEQEEEGDLPPNPTDPNAPQDDPTSLASSSWVPNSPSELSNQSSEAVQGGPQYNRSPLKPAERKFAFDQLRSYESKRRKIYTSKITSSSLYWRAFRELMTNALLETERAALIIRGAVKANQAYADYCLAVAEDRLDSDGLVVDEKRGKKLRDERWRKYHRMGNIGFGTIGFGATSSKYGEAVVPPSSPTASVGYGNSTNVKSKMSQLRAAGSDLSRENSDGVKGADLLGSYMDCKEAMADRFQTNVKFNEDVALTKIEQLKEELETEIAVMKVLGDASLIELEKAEEDVQEAWASFYVTSQRTTNSQTSAVDLPLVGKADSTASDDSKGTAPLIVRQAHDVWILEMHYRMSVAYLTTVYQKSSQELSKLFTCMKETECNRRACLREILVMHAQREERLWLSIPSLITPLLKDLLGRPMDQNSIEKDVQSSIRTRARGIQKEDARIAEETDEDFLGIQPTGPGLEGVEPIGNEYVLESPLMSNLLVKADVIEKKREGMMTVWKPTLAICTTDNFLHLFDIPVGANIRAGSAVEVAFQTLIPHVEVPTEDMVKNGRLPNAKPWFDCLIPSESIALTNSTIAFNDTKGNTTFEIKEAIGKKGFKKVGTRKLSFRMCSSVEMVEWLLALKAPN